MRNRYYILYPRDFTNEYIVYVVPNKEAAKRFEAVCEDAERITRKKSIERGWSRPRLAKECGEQWYGGFANNDMRGYPQNVEEAIEQAIDATLEYINDNEIN